MNCFVFVIVPCCLCLDFPPHTSDVRKWKHSSLCIFPHLFFTSLDCGSWSTIIILCQKKDKRRKTVCQQEIKLNVRRLEIWQRGDIPATLLEHSDLVAFPHQVYLKKYMTNVSFVSKGLKVILNVCWKK